MSYTTDSNTAMAERLYTVQSRSAAAMYENSSAYVNDRGSIASIRVISTNNLLGGKDSASRRNDGKVDDTDYVDLFHPGIQDNTYNRFLLTSVDVSYSEKTQIMTTFGDNEVVYYFGKNPVVINVQGMLIDSIFDDWFTNFVKNYQTFLRGTKLAQNFEMLELILPNMKVTGSMMSLNHHQDSARDTDIPFSFQFYAKYIEMLPALLTTGIAATNSGVKAIFTSATRSGLPSNTGASSNRGYSEPDWLKGISSNSVSTGYDIFSKNISSPIASTIASISKIVVTANGDLTKIVSSFTNPVNMVLRDITNISTQATAVANLVTSSVAGLSHLISTPGINLKNTLASLKNTAGVVSRLPEDVSTSFKRNYMTGRIQSSAAILSSGKNGTTSKAAVLASGHPYTINNSFNLQSPT